MQESTQQTMLTTWLIELYLNDLGTLKDDGDMEGHRRLQRDFHTFLEQPSLRVSRHLRYICRMIPPLVIGMP